MKGLRTNLIPKTSPETLDKKEIVLWKLNVAGALLHFTSFVAALIMSIIYASQSFETELTTDFRVYNAAGLRSYSTELLSLGYYRIIWVDLPFPIITALFHGTIAFVPSVWKYYKEGVLEKKVQPLRWIEYSITASLMIWVIMQLSGITNILTLIVVGVLGNIALQWQGYLQEKMGKTNYVPTFVGWLIFMGQWIIILTYFFTAITSTIPVTATQIPWFVYTIIIGLFLIFSVFGLIQLSSILGFPKFMDSAYAQEIAFLVMSLTAKLFLTWNLLIGIAINPVM